VDQPSCGKGLAENSLLPAKLGQLVAAVAENLEMHMNALDLEDHYSKEEYEAYRKLAKEHRIIAARLQAIGDDMAGYRHMPMGRHDHKAMTSPRVVEVFENLVRVEWELLELLQARAKSHKEMIIAMGSPGPKQ
jgi:hypothetical protein